MAASAGKEMARTYVMHEKSARRVSGVWNEKAKGAWALRIHVSEQFNEGRLYS